MNAAPLWNTIDEADGLMSGLVKDIYIGDSPQTFLSIVRMDNERIY